MWAATSRRLLHATVALPVAGVYQKQPVRADGAPRRRIRVLSFNIQWALRAEGRSKPLEPVARLAAACGADVVCVQETQVAAAECQADSGAARFGLNQPAEIAKHLQEVDGKHWHHAFGSNHEFPASHARGPAHFGNAILWSIPASHPEDAGVIKLCGDHASSISACREGRCAVGSLIQNPDIAIVTVHLGFKKGGTRMLQALLKRLEEDCYAGKAIVLCGDFNSYAEEGLNPGNPIEDAGRFTELMEILAFHGFSRVASVGQLVRATDSGAAPYVGVGRVPSQEPCFVTFPYWTDTKTRWDSVDHQLDYFFVRPSCAYPKPVVTQFVPVAAHGISDHNGLLLEIEM